MFNLIAQIKTSSTSLNIVMLILGLLCLIFAFVAIFLYRKKINKDKNHGGKFQLKEYQTKYKIFYFWGHVAYILVIFALFVAAIIFLAIFFGSI